MNIAFIVITILIVYLVISFFKNGSKRRAKIISNLILVAEANGGEFTTDAVFYEAVEKFVLENGGSVLTTYSSYIVIGENRISFLRLADTAVQIKIINEEEFSQDVLDRASGRGKYDSGMTVGKLMIEFTNSLPMKINEQITLKSVFGDNDYVWMNFKVPNNADTRLFEVVNEIIRDIPFVKNVKELGASIGINISTEDGNDTVYATLDEGYFDITAQRSGS